MQDVMTKARALFKAQSALTRIELQAKASQAVFVALALVFGLLGLGMVNVGAFLGLSPVLGPAWSALFLGVADLLLAGVIAKAAAGVTPGPQAKTARELRDLVIDSLSTDAERLKADLQGVRGSLSRMQSVISSVPRAAEIVPGVSTVVSLLTSALKKKRK